MKSVIIFTFIVGVVAIFITYGDVGKHVRPFLKYLPHGLISFVQHYIDLSSNQKTEKSKDVLLTKDELRSYRGENDSPIFLAILGKVFDVTKGRKHYKIGGSYECFAGRDGTRAYITGDFTEKGLIEDISGLGLQEILSLKEWVDFYRKDYKYVGKLIGWYYDKDGKPTQANKDYKKQLKLALRDKEDRMADIRRFPPCNSESAEGKGRRLWCTTRSGGIERDWIGLPRQYFKPGSPNPRCACVKDKGPSSDSPAQNKNNGDLDNPNMKIYDGCDPKSTSCSFKD